MGNRNGLKIGFLTRDANINNGSTRVRALQYLPHLHKIGIETRVLPRESAPNRWLQIRYIACAAQLAIWADVIILQKPNQSKVLLDLIYRINSHLIIDIDDAVWSTPLTKSGAQAEAVNHEFGNRLWYAVKRAQFVITGSHYLANTALAHCPHVETAVIPSSVDLESYQTKQEIQETAVITIGWIGSEGNLIDLSLILPALRSICANSNVKLCIISSHRPSLEGISYEFIQWSIEQEGNALSTFDIGIMPLFDNERSRGRCGYKAIQYMAVGLPVVCSPVGGGAEVVENNVTGFYAATNDEWVDRLNILINNQELRWVMGERGRLQAERLYSIQSNLPKLLDVCQRRLQRRVYQSLSTETIDHQST